MKLTIIFLKNMHVSSAVNINLMIKVAATVVAITREGSSQLDATLMPLLHVCASVLG